MIRHNKNVDYKYNQIIIKKYIYYCQKYQVNYYKAIYNKEMQHQKVISSKQQVKDEIEK